MKLKIQVNGVASVVRDINTWDDRVNRKIKTAVGKTAIGIQKEARTLCPVDTGSLRSSILTHFFPDGLTAEVSPHMPYADYVELGTVRQKAKPYMSPAAEKELPKFERRLEQILGEP